MNTPKTPSSMAPDSPRRKERESNAIKVTGKLSIPSWLSKEDKKSFKKLAKELEEIGLINKLDGISLSLLVQALSQYLKLEKEISRDGNMIDGRQGKVKNPSIGSRDNAFLRVLAVCKEFGLSPISRGKLAFSPTEEEDSFFSKDE